LYSEEVAVLNYNHLHYFHVAAVEGTVAGAALRLGVTQPTVSEQVRALEKALGVALFERKATGLKLTEAGRLAFEHTSVMFRAGERLVESLGHGGQDFPRTLRVGLSGAVARSTTTDFLMPLLALPDCVPALQLGDAAHLVRALRASELDLVLCETEPPEVHRRGLEISVIDETMLVAVAPPTIEPTPDWQNLSLLQYRASSSYRWEVEAFLDAKAYRPRVAAEADDSLFLLEAAARGGHVAFVPRSIARDAVAMGRLRILARLEPAHSNVYALYQNGESSDLARRAVEVLIQHARIGDEITR
jgi:LysR family transcriptional activator of nhaA